MHWSERVNYSGEHHSHSVEIFVDVLRNWGYFSIQVVLDAEQIMFVILCDKVYRNTTVSESTWASYSMKIRFRVVREVEVDYDVNWNDVNTTGKKICANQTSSIPIFEIVVDSKIQNEH